MRIPLTFLALAFAATARLAFAAEELVATARVPNGDTVPYVLDAVSPAPRYVLILFPGGTGVINPRMQDGKLVYGYAGNFLLRARRHFVDADFATVATNASDSEERIQAVLDDIKRRYPQALVYLAGTSNGTHYTMKLAGYLQDRIAGEIHSSSRSQIYSFDAKEFRNRHLVIHHVNDWCRVTPYSAALRSHEKFGNDFIAMEGGISVGNECEAFAHHGYNGIERETAEAIKAWIRKGG
jgi:hypothetical protein